MLKAIPGSGFKGGFRGGQWCPFPAEFVANENGIRIHFRFCQEPPHALKRQSCTVFSCGVQNRMGNGIEPVADNLALGVIRHHLVQIPQSTGAENNRRKVQVHFRPGSRLF